jgi:hypothetical protein
LKITRTGTASTNCKNSFEQARRGKFPFAEAATDVTFVCSYLEKCTFVRSFTSKKPLLSTKAKEVFLLYDTVKHSIIALTNRFMVR